MIAKVKVKKVLFVCVHNSGRSQMAEAFFNQLAKGKAAAISADISRKWQQSISRGIPNKK